MPNVYKPGLIQLRAQYSQDPDADNTPENVTWWESSSSSTPTTANLISIQALFDTYWPDVWKIVAGADASYVGSVITDWSSSSGVAVSSVGSLSPVAGTGGAASGPPQVSVLISWAIALRWRGGHFRTYLPHIASGVVTGTYKDSIAGSLATNVDTAFTACNTAMMSSGVLGGQSFRLYKDKNDSSTATLYPVTNFGCQTLLATQRRRIRHVSRK